MQREPIPEGVVLPAAAATAPAMGARHALAAVLAVAWVLVWYAGTAAGMVSIWSRSETFTHGFLVVPIVLWLIWRERARTAAIAPQPAWWPLPLLALAGFAWLLGELAAINSVTQFAMVAMVVLAVPAVLGTAAARSLAFPLGFLFFAVPTGEFLLPTLMDGTADFTVLALRLSGIPVYREGLQFVIPSGSWSVVEACSGVRYLIASLTVGTLYAYLNYRSTKRRLLFVLMSVLVPIVANWLRAYMIVMLGHLSGNRLAVGVDHLIYGWVFFGFVMLLMFWIGQRWREDEPAPQSQPRALQDVATPPAARGPWAVLAAVMAVTALAPLGHAAIARLDAAAPPRLDDLQVPGWQAREGGLTEWQPEYKAPGAMLHSVYTQGGEAIGVYLGYYRDQNHGNKLVASTNALVSSATREWARASGGALEVDYAGERIAVRSTVLRGVNGERLLVWHWYWIGGRPTASDHWAKAYTALSRLLGRGDDSAVVIVYARLDAAATANARLARFLQAAAPAIEARLRETAGRR